MNKKIGILLAAGTSSRFKNDKPKQLYPINGVPIIKHIINTMSSVVDILIVVVNDKITLNYDNIIILKNNINERKASLNTAISYIQTHFKNTNKVIIHDAARPFVTKAYFKKLLRQKQKYTQYAMKLTNGLYNIETNLPVDRDSYIELCTPICISYDILKIQTTDEMLNSIDISPHFLFGHYNILRKITTIDDI